VTSDESFEESLMAGGYGRYKTKEWVRQPQFQPQPLLVRVKPSSTPSHNGSNISAPARSSEENDLLSSIIKAENPPPTEKQLRRYHRLSVFRSTDFTNSYRLTSIPFKKSKLFVIELKDQGRVLSDTDPASTPKKKRRKPGTAPSPSPKERRAVMLTASASAAALDIYPEYPNWPDDEFPWRMREEERQEILKEEREQEMGLIENFFDWDTDGEDAPDEELSRQTRVWTRRGAFFPGQADAHRALLAKEKSLRALKALSSHFGSYRRQQQRQRTKMEPQLELAEECLCRGRVDGRVLQCNRCQAWYHPQCIGITESVDELEKDPWYCDDCVVEMDESVVASADEIVMENSDVFSSNPTSSSTPPSRTFPETHAVFSWNICKLR